VNRIFRRIRTRQDHRFRIQREALDHVQFVGVTRTSRKDPWEEAYGVDNQHIVFPAADGMARARWPYVRGVCLDVHVNRALEIHLAVIDSDVVFVLCDAIDGTIEGPVKNDAGGLAAESGIVLLC
jgi:hypothetical protein